MPSILSSFAFLAYFHVSFPGEDVSAKGVTNAVAIAVVNVGIGMSLKPCHPQ